MLHRSPRARANRELSRASCFERLYREHFAFVWSAARRLGAPTSATDDVVQEVFLTLHRRFDELDHAVSPRAWLYVVTRRVVFRHRRSRARTARKVAALARHPRTLDEPHRQRDARELLEQLLDRLPAHQRQSFVMAELLGMTAPEIAGTLGIPLNTVYSRVRLARRTLASWGDRLEELRRVDAPPVGQEKRSWGAIAVALPGSWLKGGALATSMGAWTKAVVATVAVTAVVGWTRPEPSEPVPAKSSVAEFDRAGSEPSPQVPRSTEAGEQGPEAPLMQRTRVVALRSAVPRSERRAFEATKSDPAVTLPGASDEEPGIAAEIHVLDRARQALDEGRADRALELLSDHERTFPGSSLADARGAARVRALCLQGKTAQARAEARLLRRRFPRSAVAKSRANECEAP